MEHQISLLKEGNRWVARFPFSYETKDHVKGLGFRFDGTTKAWYTIDPSIAARLDPSIGNAAVAASRAVDAEIAIPCPQGLAYLPYQKAGVAYCLSHQDVLLGDEMGLGKTIQAVGLINASPDIRRVLVVCPASLKINWQRELTRWLVRQRTIGIANGGDLPATDIVIINYDILAKHRDAIDQVQWDLLVFDEAHYLKNPKAQRTRLCLGHWDKDPAKVIEPIGAKKRLFLTGTPIVNRPVELWPLVQAINPQGLGRGGFMKFAARYCDAKQVRVSRSKTVWDFTGASNLDELQRRLRESCMVRRLKADVLKELPAKRRQVVVLPNTDPDLTAKEMEAFDRYQDAALSEKTAAFELLSALRHETALAKVPVVLGFIEDALEASERVVVFCHHRDVAQAIQANWGASAVILTGETNLPERQAAVDRFQNDPSCRVFVGTIGAAGVGITLTSAQHVIFAELDWVPGNVSQAEDRCHRIGQEGSVLVQHLVLDNSLDARQARVIVEKQEVLDAALDFGVEPIASVVVQEPRVVGPTAPLSQDGLPPAQVEAIHQCLQILAGVCDGAATRDDQGFNGTDTRFGKSLALASRLTQKQAAFGKKLIQKYHRQLPADLLATAKG